MSAPTVTMDKSNPQKIAKKASPLVIQGFSNFLGLFHAIMANPEDVFPIKTWWYSNQLC